MKKLYFIQFILIFLFFSCSKKEENTNDTSNNYTNTDEYKNYICISHTRTATNPKLDNVVEIIDFKKYDMLWLGGDLAYSTSQDDETILHVDSIYDLGNENTLWALGNHDYSDLNRIQSVTNRPAYYAYYKNGITFIILDTQDSLSNIIGEQKEMFDNVIDTISNSKFLIVLHHKLIWMYDDSVLEPQIPNVANGGLGDCFYCINPNNFYTDIYPRLIEIKQKGIEVFCIAGDIGFHTKEFEYTTQEGIHFLGEGIYFDTEGNKALIFHHNITKNTLTWEYKLLNNLEKKKF